MNLNESSIYRVALVEIRTSRRLARFWIATAVLALFSLFGYVLSCLILVYTAPYSPSLGAATPMYLFGGIDPTFFLAFQLAALVLLFDSSHQHTRNRINEVLESRPVTNFEYLAGRVLGTAFLLWLVVVALVLAMQGFGLLAQSINFNFAEPIQVHSILNLLLIDAPVTLLVWNSFIVFLSVVLRVRMLTIAVALAAMFAWFFLVLKVPYSLLSIVSTSSNDSLFVSDLLPEFASWQTIVVRTATLCGALALVVAAAFSMRRRDESSPVVTGTVFAIALGLCGGAYAWSISDVVRQFGEPAKWREVHSTHTWNGSIDLQSVTGKVLVQPGKRVDIDLYLSLRVDSVSARDLVFTLNPAMTISQVEIDGLSTNYTFKDGLLEIAHSDPLDVDSPHTLRVVAHGVPNPRFAYFDSAVEYLTSPDVPTRSVRLFGRDGSIFDPKFVALMPGVYWYPVPGPVRGDFLWQQREKDFFDVDLAVELQSKNLQLVGTGTSTSVGDSSTSYRVKSDTPVPEIGLFAANFVKTSLDIDGIEFSMYVHERHTKNLSLAEGVVDTLQDQARVWLRPFTRHGLTIPHKRIAFVEVPNRLRTVGGGWRMDSTSALPGIVLMKAQGFPRTKFHLALRFAKRDRDEDQLSLLHVRLLAQFFAMGIGTDNLWSTVPEHLWSHVTSAKGDHAEALDQIVLSLIASQTWTHDESFSIYSTLHVANTTAVSPYTLNYGADPEGWTPNSFEVRDSEVSHGRRQSLWTHMERNGLADLPSSYGNQRDLELMLLKSSSIAGGILFANGVEKVFKWLATVREKFSGQSFTYQDLIETANEQEIIVDPFLTDWLHESRLPGYLTKPITVERIADDDQGNPRYQTSVTVRNVEPVTGFVGVQNSYEQPGEEHFPFSTSTKGIRIEGDSAKRINLISSQPTSQVRLFPRLSLNRVPMVLWSSPESVQENLDAQEAPFEETSDWTPQLEGIVVDDLDLGFSVFQPMLRQEQSANVGPFDWFRPHRLELELDNGIPTTQGQYVYGVTSRLWNRRALASAFGKFRRTVATTWVRDPSSFHIVRFATELPESALWKLEYHLPPERYYYSRRGEEEMKYQLAVTDGSQTWNVELVSNRRSGGWNELGEFEIQAGTTNVDLVGVSSRGSIYADAIRWTKN